MNVAQRQDYTRISKRWENPYAAQAVYVPLAELVKTYAYLYQNRPANGGGKLYVTETLLVEDWTDFGRREVDAYIVAGMGSRFSAGVRFGEGADVLTPYCNEDRLEALHNKYCPQVRSADGMSTARVRWNRETGPTGLSHQLLFDVETDSDDFSFDAVAMVELLVQTNRSYADQLFANAKKKFA
jgi:hypothetical protein